MKGVDKEKSKMFPKLYKMKKRQKARRINDAGEEIESEGEEEFEDEDGSLVSE